jgi:hypothetical protein
LTARDEKPLAALSRAVANLLRLASSDIKDAEILASGRSPDNAPLLLHIAARRMIEAIIATERGWPVETDAVEFSQISDENPAKLVLARISKLALPPKPVGLLSDGSIPKTFDSEAFRRDVASVRKLLLELAGTFDVDLLRDGPAKQIAVIRPPPKAEPPKVMEKPRETPAPARRATRKQLPPVRSKLSHNEKVRPISLPDTRAGPQVEASHEVERRSPILVPPGRPSITSAAFGQLMDRWNVPDLAALDLIGHQDGLSKKGTRRRFKLTDEEGEMVKLLFEIDQAMSSLQLDPKNWINKPIQAPPFAGAKPIAFLTKHGVKGVVATSRYLFKNGLKLSISGTP